MWGCCFCCESQQQQGQDEPSSGKPTRRQRSRVRRRAPRVACCPQPATQSSLRLKRFRVLLEMIDIAFRMLVPKIPIHMSLAPTISSSTFTGSIKNEICDSARYTLHWVIDSSFAFSLLHFKSNCISHYIQKSAGYAVIVTRMVCQYKKCDTN